MPASANVKGGFWGQYGLTMAPAHGYSPLRRRIRSLLSRQSTFALKEIMHELNGVAPGATATKQLARIAASSELGGKRTIETFTYVNRATTAADVTEIDNTILNAPVSVYDNTPVANLDGNPLGTR